MTIDSISRVQARIATIQASLGQSPPVASTTSTDQASVNAFDAALASTLGLDDSSTDGTDPLDLSALGASLPGTSTSTASSLTSSLASSLTQSTAPAADRSGGAATPGTYVMRGDSPYTALFQQAGQRYGVDPAVLEAVARAESGFNPNARSGAGAQGLMQIMPSTAKGLGVNPMDPAQAVDGAARILAGNLDKFGSLDLALAAYNAGAGAVQKYGGVPPYKETQNYVRKIDASLQAAR